ncbi:nitroreductase/quinone reductase family protein [Natrialbaceae archaeon AArc-T1-2]|uniref:nitroreductase/quinone reductase family protein n=1 Tax=Natrialbaceae archaeon AArc-T1-2 TaxID=3053904 RepID=UPI00255ACE64|nr:nitroreductase/quinone reductase family protein [Natrialbaceae archaeon AArc-T1-2]WIV66039.1 nitroreductase/quinone reductase family protein [Natrialbaceae archaeon AArc-T1-2]
MSRIRDRFIAVALALEARVANPIVAAVLRSSFHPLLSRWLLVLSYEGRRSGRRYTTPVLYREVDDELYLVTPAAYTTWWRNFGGGHPATVLYRGRWRRGVGSLVTDADAVIAHLRWLFAPVRRLSRTFLGRSRPGEDRLRRIGSGLVLVVVDLEQ